MVTIRIATTDVAISMQIWRLKSYRIHVCIMRTCYPRFVVTDFNFIPYAPCGFLVINGYYSVPLSVSGIFILSNYRHGVIGLSPSRRTITLQRSAALYVSTGISHLMPPNRRDVSSQQKSNIHSVPFLRLIIKQISYWPFLWVRSVQPTSS